MRTISALDIAGGTMTSQSILVIEDFQAWARLVRKLLVSCGYSVYLAANCAEALELAIATRPDCLLLDFNLPDGDAVSLCASLRENPVTARIPVVIITGDTERRASAMELCRAAAFLEKGPHWVRELPETLARVLAGAAGKDF